MLGADLQEVTVWVQEVDATFAPQRISDEPVRWSVRVVPERHGHRPKPLDNLDELLRTHAKGYVLAGEAVRRLEEHLPAFGESHARDLILSSIPCHREPKNRPEKASRGFVVLCWKRDVIEGDGHATSIHLHLAR